MANPLDPRPRAAASTLPSLVIATEYDVIRIGLACMLEPFRHRVRVVSVVPGARSAMGCDILLYDTTPTMRNIPAVHVSSLMKNYRARILVLYTWDAGTNLVHGTVDVTEVRSLSKATTAEELVRGLEQAHAGEPPHGGGIREYVAGTNWHGQEFGLTEREARILTLIVHGLSNYEIAGRMYLSINTVKSYIRTAYRTMGVHSRSQAMLWAFDRGFQSAVLW